MTFSLTFLIQIPNKNSICILIQLKITELCPHFKISTANLTVAEYIGSVEHL